MKASTGAGLVNGCGQGGTAINSGVNLLYQCGRILKDKDFRVTYLRMVGCHNGVLLCFLLCQRVL